MNFNFLKYLSIISILLFLISCKMNNIGSHEELNDIKVINDISKKFFTEADSVITIPNNSGNYILFLSEKKASTQNPNNSIKFFIYCKTKNSIVYKDSLDNSSVKWLDSEHLELTKYYGIIKEDAIDNIKTFLINIKNGSITETNNKHSNI